LISGPFAFYNFGDSVNTEKTTDRFGELGVKLKIAIGLAAICGLALAAPSFAGTKPKKASGVYCEQGGNNVSFPISQYKPKDRKRLRVGQKARINIAGVGPIDCRVY
jgi:hypothetical protein